jgi:hypothetical protein
MQRILMFCAAVALGAGVAPAAGPKVEPVIKALEAVAADAGKLERFCDLHALLHVAGGTGDEEDPEVQKEVDRLITDMSPEYGTAMDVYKELDGSSPDKYALDVAIDALLEKCP